jgi:hypothetical protein
MRKALLLLLFVCAGCDAVDELFGRDETKRDTLRLQSIAITTDHPVDPNVPGGAAVATNGAIVRFIATGTFVNIETDAVSEGNISSAVAWESDAPAFLLPGSDGRVAITTTAGSATITASTPAVGEIPALTSNSITLTVQP